MSEVQISIPIDIWSVIIPLCDLTTIFKLRVCSSTLKKLVSNITSIKDKHVLLTFEINIFPKLETLHIAINDVHSRFNFRRILVSVMMSPYLNELTLYLERVKNPPESLKTIIELILQTPNKISRFRLEHKHYYFEFDIINRRLISNLSAKCIVTDNDEILKLKFDTLEWHRVTQLFTQTYPPKITDSNNIFHLLGINCAKSVIGCCDESLNTLNIGGYEIGRIKEIYGSNSHKVRIIINRNTCLKYNNVIVNNIDSSIHHRDITIGYE